MDTNVNENENVNTQADPQATLVPTTPVLTAAPKSRRAPAKPKATVRDIETLRTASIKGMSDVEKAKLIESLLNENCLVMEQNKAIRKNAESAFERARILEDQLLLVRQKTREFVQYTLDSIHHCNVSANLAVSKLEEAL